MTRLARHLPPPARRRQRHSRVVPLIAVLVLAACSSESGSVGGSPAHQGAPVPVTAATVTQRDVPIELRAIGRVEPVSTVALKAQVEGQIANVHFHEGDRVKTGEMLFTIDPRPFEAALRQAEANLARDVAQAQNADADRVRKERLFKQGVVSVEEYDAAATQAAATHAVAEASHATVDNARLQLQYCYVRSPIDGRIGEILVHEGNVVKKNETTLAVINQLRPIDVAFTVPEQALPEVRARAADATLPVRAFIGPDRTHAVTGDLHFVNNTVDVATGTVLLKGRFANDDEALWPGQFVDVSLLLYTQPDAILVDSAAVQTGQRGAYAFVVKPDSTVEIRPLDLGQSVGSETIVTQGLAAGDRVVTEGQIRLATGMKVEVKGGAQPAPTQP
jgi:multidrug efflux system membrane fusion protein